MKIKFLLPLLLFLLCSSLCARLIQVSSTASNHTPKIFLILKNDAINVIFALNDFSKLKCFV